MLAHVRSIFKSFPFIYEQNKHIFVPFHFKLHQNWMYLMYWMIEERVLKLFGNKILTILTTFNIKNT